MVVLKREEKNITGYNVYIYIIYIIWMWYVIICNYCVNRIECKTFTKIVLGITLTLWRRLVPWTRRPLPLASEVPYVWGPRLKTPRVTMFYVFKGILMGLVVAKLFQGNILADLVVSLAPYRSLPYNLDPRSVGSIAGTRKLRPCLAIFWYDVNPGIDRPF